MLNDRTFNERYMMGVPEVPVPEVNEVAVAEVPGLAESNWAFPAFAAQGNPSNPLPGGTLEQPPGLTVPIEENNNPGPSDNKNPGTSVFGLWENQASNMISNGDSPLVAALPDGTNPTVASRVPAGTPHDSSFSFVDESEKDRKMPASTRGGMIHSPGSMTSSKESQALHDLFDSPATFKPRRPMVNEETLALRKQVQMLQQSQAMTHNLLQQLLAGSNSGKPSAPQVVSPAIDGTGRNGPTVQVKLEGPPVRVETHTKDKKIQRQAKAQKKRDQAEQQEQRRQDQEKAQQAAKDSFMSHVMEQEHQRTKDVKKKANASTNNNKKPKAANGKAVNKTAKGGSYKTTAQLIAEGSTKTNEQIAEIGAVYREMKVIKHGTTDGVFKALFRYDGVNKWIPVEQIWRPNLMATLLPAWREYCRKKNFPNDWGNPGGTGNGNSDTEEEEEELKEKELEENGEDSPAVCIGHKLDDHGAVYMKLKWTDDPNPSWAGVKGIMNVSKERAAFGQTWFAYCAEKGYVDDLFRVHGTAAVESVKGHDWADCGRPMAEIRWKHGEVTKPLVHKAYERSNDNNGFKRCWNLYCESLGNVSESFKKGHVDKDHKKETKRKRKRH